MTISESELQIAAIAHTMADSEELSEAYLAIVRGEKEDYSAVGPLVAAAFKGLEGVLEKDDAKIFIRKAIEELGVTVEST